MPETFNNLFQNTSDIILFIFAVIILIVFIGCIYAFFRAIFLFIFSNGEEEKRKKAWDTIRFMIIGLFWTILLLFFGPMIAKLFVPDDVDTSVYTAKNVFKKMWQIVSTTADVITIIVQNYPDGRADFSSLSKKDELVPTKIYL